MTRYAIADLDGRSHAYFDDRVAAREALREMEAEDPRSIDELYLVGYGRDGKRVCGPEAAEDVLRSKRTLESADHQYAAVSTGPLDPPKKRLRKKKPSRGKPFDPCDKNLALA
jgi:hypothetical protein